MQAHIFPNDLAKLIVLNLLQAAAGNLSQAIGQQVHSHMRSCDVFKTNHQE